MEIYLVLAIGVSALLFSMFKSAWVNKQDAGEGKMTKIAGYIADGALAFLKAEYRVLSIFVLIIAALIGFLAQEEHSHWLIGVAFIIGAFFSAFAGFLGMKIATKSNVRTAQAARTSLSKALAVSFSGGLVMGINVV